MVARFELLEELELLVVEPDAEPVRGPATDIVLAVGDP